MLKLVSHMKSGGIENYKALSVIGKGTCAKVLIVRSLRISKYMQ